MKRLRDYIEHDRLMKKYDCAIKICLEEQEKHLNDEDPEEFRAWAKTGLLYLHAQLDELKRFDNL